MALERFRAPALPIPNAEYDQRTMTDIIRALRLYFNQLDSLTPNQAQSYRADNFYGGEFDGTVMTANNVATSTLTATYSNVSSMMSEFIRSKGFLGGNFVGGTFMGGAFYGNYFYGDGQYLLTPYNQFTSNQNQTAGALGTAYAVTMNANDFPNGISIVNNSEITFAEAGIYLITYSIQFQNADAGVQHVDIWFRYEGSDIASSNSRFGLPQRKSAGVPSELIAVTPFMVDVVASGDQVQIMWHPSDLNVSIKQFAAEAASPGVNPAIPATPSVIVTVQHISAQHPAVKRVAPISVTGFGQIGTVIVNTTNTI